MTGLIYIIDQDKKPLQNVLQQLLLVNQTSSTASVGVSDAQRAADQMKFGIIIVSTLPLLVLYPFLQKYFNKGVMLGAVKAERHGGECRIPAVPVRVAVRSRTPCVGRRRGPPSSGIQRSIERSSIMLGRFSVGYERVCRAVPHRVHD